MWGAFLEPWGYDFMRAAACMVALLGVQGGLAGSVVVLQRSALQVESFAHALLPGLALAYLLVGRSLWALVLGGVASLFATRLLGMLFSRHPRVDPSTGGAIVIALNFSTGLLLLHHFRDRLPIALDHFVLGDLLATTWDEVGFAAGATGLMALGAVAFRAQVKVFLLDPAYAARRGLNRTLAQGALQLAVAVACLISFKAVGFVLTLALMTVAPAAAQLGARHLWQMQAYGALWGAAGGLLGLTLSYHLDVPSGPAIILTLVAGYLLALARAHAVRRRRPAP